MYGAISSFADFVDTKTRLNMKAIATILPIWVALASAVTPTKSYNASAGVTPLPNKDYSNEQLALLWAQVCSFYFLRAIVI